MKQNEDGQPVKNATPPRYGSFNSRIMASAVDMLIIMAVAVPVIDFISDRIFNPFNTNIVMNAITAPEAQQNIQTLMQAVWKMIRDNHLIERAVFSNFMQLIFVALYTLPFWFRYCATPGKMLFRMEIKDATTLEYMTRWQCVIRFLGYLVSFIPLTLGFLWIIVNRKKQGWHDSIANTVVVVKPKKRPEK